MAADQGTPAKKEEVVCQGQIDGFVKDGFQAFAVEGAGCEWFDITWIRVESPDEFTGVRHMLLSKSPDGKSAFGTIGARISFRAFRSTLDVEKHPEKILVDSKKLLKDLKENTK